MCFRLSHNTIVSMEAVKLSPIGNLIEKLKKMRQERKTHTHTHTEEVVDLLRA